MPELMDVITKRRSIRKFASEQVPEQKLHAVLRAGLLAPTSMNKKPCEFYVVSNRALLRQLSQAKEQGAAFLADAPAAIAVCGLRGFVEIRRLGRGLLHCYGVYGLDGNQPGAWQLLGADASPPLFGRG